MSKGGSTLERSSADDSRPDETEGRSESNALLVMAIAEGTDVRGELYARFRRPLLQVFLQRRIQRDAAQDLMQLTFLAAIKKIRVEGLEDPQNLGGYLYRTALRLANAYRRGEFAHPTTSVDDVLSDLRDDALSIEERVDHQILSKCIRDLMKHLSLARDREVLLRYYLNEEPKDAICITLGLTDLQFNQVLWRARQRFGEILRRHGLATAARCPMLIVALAFAIVGATEGKVFLTDVDDIEDATELHSSVSFDE